MGYCENIGQYLKDDRSLPNRANQIYISTQKIEY